VLERALSGGHVHHAYLFDGQAGVGKELAAFGLAQALVCSQPQSHFACGDCSACKRANPRGEKRLPVHPDVVVLERGLYDAAQIGRKSPETQDISVDQVRTLVLARAAFRAHEDRAKVFIVRGAEDLSISAANALLKTLEEPMAGTFFILLTAQPDALLPTIRSRAQRVRFGALSNAVLDELLTDRGIDADVRERSIALAKGSMEDALRAGVQEAPRYEPFVASTREALGASSFSRSLDIGEEMKRLSRDGSIEALHAVARAFVATAKAEASVPSGEVWAERFGLVSRAIAALEGNGSPQLVGEALLSRLRRT
jgi:DNA polymerase-3 subunit delta'